MEEREVIIVGGGPAGLSAAIFTQLDGWSTLVLEGSWVGGQGAIAYTVSNYPGFPPMAGYSLSSKPVRWVKRCSSAARTTLWPRVSGRMVSG